MQDLDKIVSARKNKRLSKFLDESQDVADFNAVYSRKFDKLISKIEDKNLKLELESLWNEGTTAAIKICFER